MTISVSGELISKISTSLGSSSDLLEPEGLEFAALQAINELGWSYPISNSRREFWCIQRGKRHALDLLRVQSAHRFKYKQISLNQRFDHYQSLIESMDKSFYEALEKDPILSGVDMSKAFGTYIENGFVYDQFGNDITKIMKDLSIDNEGYRKRYL